MSGVLHHLPYARCLMKTYIHVGESDLANFILLSRARQKLQAPFIASGSSADGQGLAATLCLGASGINMGTRLFVKIEAPVHENVQ